MLKQHGLTLNLALKISFVIYDSTKQLVLYSNSSEAIQVIIRLIT